MEDHMYPEIELFLKAWQALEEIKNKDEAQRLTEPSEKGRECLWDFVEVAYNAKSQIEECLEKARKYDAQHPVAEFPMPRYGKPC